MAAEGRGLRFARETRGEQNRRKAKELGDGGLSFAGTAGTGLATKRAMNTPNAFGFIGVGLLMELLSPLVALNAVRELWLVVMGAVLLLTGGGFLLRRSLVWLVPRLVTPMVSALGRRDDMTDSALPDARRSAV